MAHLLVAQDADLMLLEIIVENLYVPWITELDRVILKKTTVMFRMLDEEWTSLSPQRKDYRTYRGSSYEDECFHGGLSIVFALPRHALRKPMTEVDLQCCARKNISGYFEAEPCQRVGLTLIRVDHLFNGIIKELQERRRLKDYLSPRFQRRPISRSMKCKSFFLDEQGEPTESRIELYLRITYLKSCLITEIDVPKDTKEIFYAREESTEAPGYRCRELTKDQLGTGNWAGGGDPTFSDPTIQDSSSELQSGKGPGAGVVEAAEKGGERGKEGKEGKGGKQEREGKEGKGGKGGKQGKEGKEGKGGKQEGGKGGKGGKQGNGGEGSEEGTSESKRESKSDKKDNNGVTNTKHTTNSKEYDKNLMDHNNDGRLKKPRTQSELVAEKKKLLELLTKMSRRRKGGGGVTVGLMQKFKSLCPPPPCPPPSACEMVCYTPCMRFVSTCSIPDSKSTRIC